MVPLLLKSDPKEVSRSTQPLKDKQHSACHKSLTGVKKKEEGKKKVKVGLKSGIKKTTWAIEGAQKKRKVQILGGAGIQ